MDLYCLEVINKEGGETAATDCKMSTDGSIVLVAEDFDERTCYSFTIISNNSIGQSTTAVPYCKQNFIFLLLN